MTSAVPVAHSKHHGPPKPLNAPKPQNSSKPQNPPKPQNSPKPLHDNPNSNPPCTYDDCFNKHHNNDH
ncbi:4804_t:CDS:2 [Cetraspora pellucida]|uniref:4804_t:CDS:1 n=1 Tax=Cetraspora pellucida TaxID=1433469 RepID=A0ACA9L7X9_9GLOM|nr:4804_t:CDS:2 [Cetraspora pellucida]